MLQLVSLAPRELHVEALHWTLQTRILKGNVSTQLGQLSSRWWRAWAETLAQNLEGSQQHSHRALRELRPSAPPQRRLRPSSSVQFSSVAQSCRTLCDPMNHSTPGLPVHHQLPEFTQTHVHRVRDAIQPCHPRSSPSPPAPNPSQHQSLFQ